MEETNRVPVSETNTLNDMLQKVETTEDFIQLLEEMKTLNLKKNSPNYSFYTIDEFRLNGVHDDGKMHRYNIHIETHRIKPESTKIWYTIMRRSTQKTKGMAARNLSKNMIIGLSGGY